MTTPKRRGRRATYEQMLVESETLEAQLRAMTRQLSGFTEQLLAAAEEKADDGE